jgi:anti-anti-sigma factor
MKIDKTVQDTHAVLTLKGEFDTFYCPKLQEEVDSLISAGTLRVILNLRLVKFINSTALGAIIKAHKRFKAEGGDLVLSGPSPFCKDIITKLGIDRVVPMYADDEKAEKALLAKDAPQNTAELPDDASMIFSFSDAERADILKGRTAGVGTISNVQPDRIQFVWDFKKHGFKDRDASTLFKTGSAVQTKFQLKLFKKGFFEVAAKVESAEIRTDGTVKVSAVFTNISESDRLAIDQFASDMAYLKSQVKEAGGR